MSGRIWGQEVYAQHFMKNENSLKRIEFLKKNIRKQIQKNRDNLLPEYREESSSLIAAKFFNAYYYINSENISIYYSFRSEVDTTIIIKKALKDKKKIILPRIFNNNLVFYFVKDLSKQLEKSTYGIMEPVPDLSIPAKISDIELIVVPGVSFDRNLNRLGYGLGYYDKILQNIPEKVKKVALCFDIQIVDNIPVAYNDIKVDVIITESSIYNLK